MFFLLFIKKEFNYSTVVDTGEALLKKLLLLAQRWFTGRLPTAELHAVILPTAHLRQIPIIQA